VARSARIVGVLAFAQHPGIVRTPLRARAFPGEDPSRLPPPDSVADAFLDLALPECTRNGAVVIARATISSA
jgi:hypothetical protein